MVRVSVCRIALLVLLMALLPASTALAHAVLVSSIPADGSRLKTPPSRVEARFNEPVVAEFTPLMVRNQAGKRVDRGDARVHPSDPTMVFVELSPLPPGFFTVSYRITSLDGHPVQGSIAFSVGEAAPVPPPEARVASRVLPAFSALAHGAAQLTAILLAGLTAFLLVVWKPLGESLPARQARLWASGLGCLLVGTGAAEIVLYALRASGEPLSVALLGQVLSTRMAGLWFLRAGLGTAAAVALANVHRISSTSLRVAALLPGAALLLTLTFQGHAIATQETLPVLADWLHLVAAAPWVGGLFGLAIVTWPSVRARPAAERLALWQRAVPRFSQVAVVSVVVLVITGLYSTSLHVSHLESLMITPYGQALSVKLLLFVAVLGLGGYNFVGRGRGAFRAAVWAEVALITCMFGAIGFLTTLPPAKVDMFLRQGPFQATQTQQGLEISLTVEPKRVGHNQWTVKLNRTDGTPVTGASVGLRVAMRAHDMGLQNPEAREEAPGVYRGDPVVLGMPGEWSVEVVVLTRQGQEIREQFVLNVPPVPSP